MCGIISYVGRQKALPILMEGLKRMEYRGYDSAGFAVVEEGRTTMVRSVGKVNRLVEKKAGIKSEATFGIAHTRWATHGKPSEANCHPQTDCSGKISVVHNGIIENYVEIRNELIQKGHEFRSETDTEVIAHLVEEHFDGDLETAVIKSINHMVGTFGIAVVHAEVDQKIIVARRGSPIIIGVGDDEYFAASDSNALSPYTNRMIYLADDEIAILNSSGYVIKNARNEILEKSVEIYDEEQFTTDRKGFPHFMLKEIFEQPESVENAFRGRLMENEGVSKLGGLEPVLDRLKTIDKIVIVSCGTSYYAGLVGRYIFENLTRLNVETALASEFRYRRQRLNKNVAVLAISQSGETADTMAAIKEAHRKGALPLGIVNVVGSSIAQLTEAGVYNYAGPEIGVASTKIYTSQLVILTLMALLIGRYQDLSFNEGFEIIGALKRLPEQIRRILKDADAIQEIALKYADYRDFLFIGRMLNYPTAMEGALKLKEISYIHAEGYPAGEMKHGPISLIDENFPTVAIAPVDSVYEKMISNIQEIKARNGRVLAVTDSNDGKVNGIADDVIVVPRTIELLQPILNIIPLQLFAYYIARHKGRDIDKPRNLAKSVTVE